MTLTTSNIFAVDKTKGRTVYCTPLSFISFTEMLVVTSARYLRH